MPDDAGRRFHLDRPTSWDGSWRHGPVGLAPNRARADREGTAYVVERKDRFYVVTYDGLDPATGRERRRWHPAGRSRADAEAIAARLDAITAAEVTITAGQLTLGRYPSEQFAPQGRTNSRNLGPIRPALDSSVPSVRRLISSSADRMNSMSVG